MDEKYTPSEQQNLQDLEELISLIHKADQQIAAGDDEAEIALQYFTEELKRLGYPDIEYKLVDS